jgi:hypothetical protein
VAIDCWIVDTLPSKLACNGEIVVSTPETIAVVDELYTMYQLFSSLKSTHVKFAPVGRGFH